MSFNKVLRISFFLISGVFILLSILFFVFLNPWMEKKINTTLAKLEGYHFTYEDVSINPFLGNISFEMANLAPKIKDTTYTHYYVKFKNLSIKGVSYFELLKNNRLQISTVSIEQPDITLLNAGSGKQQDGGKKPDFTSHELFKKLKCVYIELLRVENGKIRITRAHTEAKTALSFSNLSLNISNILLDSITAVKNNGLPSWKHMNISSSSNTYLLPDNKHRLQVSTLNWSDKDSILQATDVSIVSLKPSGQNSIKFLFPLIYADKVNMSALLNGQIKVKKVSIHTPVASIVLQHDNKNTTPEDPEEPILKDLPDMEIDEISLKGGKLVMRDITKKFVVYLTEMDHTIKNLRFEGPENKDSVWLLPSMHTSIKNLRVVFQDSMYVLTGKNFLLQNNRSVEISTLALVPQYTKRKFAEKMQIQGERFEVTCGQLKLSDLNLRALFSENSLTAKEMVIENIKFRAYRDKNYPHDGKVRQLPSVVLKNYKNYVNLRQFKILNGHFTYEERLPEAVAESQITFTRVNGTISNITNDRSAADSKLRIAAKGYAFGKSPAALIGEFDLKNKSGQFSMSGNSGKIEMKALNPVLENTLFLSIEEGVADSMRFSLSGNNINTNGKMKLYYHDLKVNLLNKKTAEKQGLKAHVGSFIIDKLLVRSANPEKNGTLREGSIQMQRDSTRSVFNYMAKNMLSGILSSVAPAVAELKEKIQ
jgi:hypothetical protein